MAKAGYIYYLVESAQLRLNELGFTDIQLSVHERSHGGRKDYCLVCHFASHRKWQVTSWCERIEFRKIMEGVEGVLTALHTGSTARQIPRPR